MPPLPPLPMTTLAAIGGEGFAACLWVDLRPESVRHQCRVRGYDDMGEAGTHNGNYIKDGGSKIGWWTA
jgi:hypothetical protein